MERKDRVKVEAGWPNVIFSMKSLERAEGIEPSYAAWKTAVLPLNYARNI